MNYYLHGDNNYASRVKLNEILNELKSKLSNPRIISLNPKSYEESSFVDSLRKNPLFDEAKIYLIENLKSFGKKQQEKILKDLAKYSQNTIIWDKDKTSLPNQIKKYFPDLQVFCFEQPKIMFKFLEEVYPGNQRIFLKLFLQLSGDQPVELIFYFLKKHLHNLLTAESPSSELASWQKKKLLGQLEKFTPQKAALFYKKIIQTEYFLKTGKLQTDLDLALVNLLATL